MATRQDFVDYVLDQAGLFPRLSSRRMFGEYALYLDDKVVGFACDNSLFIKITTASDAWAQRLPRGEAYPGSKPYLVADELLDQPSALAALLEATAAVLPLPKPKSRPKSRNTHRKKQAVPSGNG
ncbi:MAG: TfoX/Sxy family protein [Lautropia sp.]|nr:TfoX/Sxy family protein [Lautropia sp.]